MIAVRFEDLPWRTTRPGARAKRLETQAAVLRWRMGLEDGQPHSTADTARQLGLSLAETRDIEARAFEHIREAIPVRHLQKFLEG